MGIRSERRLCEEVHLNLAYRWFCRLGLDGKASRLKVDFAIEPLRMPFKPRRAFQLFSHLFNDPSAKPFPCRRVDGRAARLSPAKFKSPVRFTRPT